MLYFFLAFPFIFIFGLIYFVWVHVFQTSRLRKERQLAGIVTSVVLTEPAARAWQRVRWGQAGLGLFFVGWTFWLGRSSAGPSFFLLGYAWIFFAYLCWKLFLTFGPRTIATRLRGYLAIDVIFTLITFTGGGTLLVPLVMGGLSFLILSWGWEIPFGVQTRNTTLSS